MNHTFNSCTDYYRFSGAKGFYEIKNQKEIAYPKHFLEKVGDRILSPTVVPIDRILQNIKNPLMIVALTVAAIAITTIAFYPEVIASAIGTLFPFLLKVQPRMLKFAVFSVIEINILGLGLRTLGRLCNDDLMQAWTSKKIEAISIGTFIKVKGN